MSGLSDVAFAIYWVLEQEEKVAAAGVDPLAAAQEIEAVLTKFPNWREDAGQKRQLRRNLCKPLLAIGTEERAQVIEHVMQVLERTA